jgi:hypothetical protein
MPSPDRPQAPGYLANLMARLFHEVSAEGLAPLGVRPEQFPILIELWFGDGASRASLCATQEAAPGWIDVLVATLATDGLIDPVPSNPAAPLQLTPHGADIREAAIAAAPMPQPPAHSAKPKWPASWT